VCGIAGIYKFNSRVDKEQLKQMTDILSHRGPDGDGQWVEGNIGLGHRRLSIIDLSNAASQPMLAVDGRYSITFNGEIYNYLELKKQLLDKGASFKTQSDTEVLIWAFHFYREKSLELLDGMFAFAIWDKIEKKLFAARDRFGEKPFFYAKNGQELVFASEIKAIWKFGFEKTMLEKAFYNYWVYDILEDPLNPENTFFKNIFQLPAAHFLTISADNNLKIKRYWDIDLNKKSKDNELLATNKTKELLKQSVALRLRSDVAIGSSLSGGLDSSVIVALINSLKLSGQAQKTFSARFHSNKDEGKYIDEVVSALDVQRNDVWISEDDVMNDIEKIFWHHDEPVSSGSVVAQWKVMELAKKNDVTVMLDGQGADEVFAGYEYFYRKFFGQLLKSKPREYFKAIQAYYQTYPNGNGFKVNGQFIAQTIFPNLSGKIALRANQLQLSNVTHGLDVKFNKQFVGTQYPYRHYFNLNRDLYEAVFGGKLQHLLRLADRNAMAHSVEVRLPYLSHLLVEYAFALPAAYKIKNGFTKNILRNAFDNDLPSSIIWRKNKIGYEAPQQDWLMHPAIIEKVERSLLKCKENGIIHKLDLKNLNPRERWKLMSIENLLH